MGKTAPAGADAVHFSALLQVVEVISQQLGFGEQWNQKPT